MSHYAIPDDIIHCIKSIIHYHTPEENQDFLENPCTNHIYLQMRVVSAWLDNIIAFKESKTIFADKETEKQFIEPKKFDCYDFRSKKEGFQ